MAAARTRAARALPLALAVALAVGGPGACTVEVDGAPCRVPGAVEDCPGDQACGNDLRCSARALACAASRCAPGAGGACLDPDGVASGDAVARRCTGADPVCGAWVDEPCAPGGLVCGTRSGGAACECPAMAGRELTVHPGGSAAAAPPYPTGAASPPACSFRRLGDALAAAAAIAADPAAVATVTATGAAAGATRTFSAAATGEVFPLVVRERVALGSDAAASGGTYEIVFDPAGAASAPVELHSGGALAGLTVRNGSGGAASDGVALRCDGKSAPALLAGVVLDGRGASGARLGTGVAVDGTCGVVARDLQVRGFAGAGVLVVNGRVLLDGARIEGNGGFGVRGNDERLLGIPRVEIRSSKIVGNGDTGIALVNASEVRITGTKVYGNAAVTAWGGTGVLSGIARKAGGVVFWGNPPAFGSFEFGRNRIYANGGDQVLVLGSNPAQTWALDGQGCGTDAAGPLYSHVGCYDPTPAGTTSYRGVVALDATVSATNLAWQDGAAPPSRSADYEYIGTGNPMAVTPYCTAPAGVLACDVPP